jgi:hypothetical protein
MRFTSKYYGSPGGRVEIGCAPGCLVVSPVLSVGLKLLVNVLDQALLAETLEPSGLGRTFYRNFLPSHACDVLLYGVVSAQDREGGRVLPRAGGSRGDDAQGS